MSVNKFLSWNQTRSKRDDPNWIAMKNSLEIDKDNQHKYSSFFSSRNMTSYS